MLILVEITMVISVEAALHAKSLKSDKLSTLDKDTFEKATDEKGEVAYLYSTSQIQTRQVDHFKPPLTQSCLFVCFSPSLIEETGSWELASLPVPHCPIIPATSSNPKELRPQRI